VTEERQLPGDAFVRWNDKGPGIEDHDPGDPLRAPGRAGHADHPPPVMNDERYVILKIQIIQEGFHIVHVTCQSIGKILLRRAGGKSATDMIGNDYPVIGTEGLHDLPVIKGPGGIAMDGYHRIALPFIKIVVNKPRSLQPIIGKGIKTPMRGNIKGETYVIGVDIGRRESHQDNIIDDKKQYRFIPGSGSRSPSPPGNYRQA